MAAVAVARADVADAPHEAVDELALERQVEVIGDGNLGPVAEGRDQHRPRERRLLQCRRPQSLMRLKSLRPRYGSENGPCRPGDVQTQAERRCVDRAVARFAVTALIVERAAAAAQADVRPSPVMSHAKPNRALAVFGDASTPSSPTKPASPRKVSPRGAAGNTRRAHVVVVVRDAPVHDAADHFMPGW